MMSTFQGLLRSLAAIVAAAMLSVASWAAPAPPAVRAEIDALLSRLESTDCQFHRNGSWHAGSDAKVHLMRKLDYLANRTTLRSAEQFIELAATASSASGQPYQVKCGTGAPQPSAQWLTKELSGLRAASRAAAR